jgi:hypothetical protein
MVASHQPMGTGVNWRTVADRCGWHCAVPEADRRAYKSPAGFGLGDGFRFGAAFP